MQTALLFAKGLYSIYLNKGENFVEKYDKLLDITGKNNLWNIARTCITIKIFEYYTILTTNVL